LGRVTLFPAGEGLRAIDLADVNHDDHLDILAADNMAGMMRVLLGDDEGGFGSAASYATGLGPVKIVATHLDADGEVDAVTANGGSGDVSVLRGGGNGTFLTARQFV